MSRRRIVQIALWVAGVALTVFVVLRISQMVKSSVLMKLMDAHQSLVDGIVMGALGVYTALIATPFVPGAEIGMALLSMFGASIAVEVYLATVLGLGIGYLVGRLVPVRRTAALLKFLCLTRAGTWLDDMAELPPETIVEHLTERLEPGLGKRLVRWRYLALILLINLPGNIVLGGGGGIAVAAGMSRLFSPWGFLAATLVAVSPVPLMVLLMGSH